MGSGAVAQRSERVKLGAARFVAGRSPRQLAWIETGIPRRVLVALLPRALKLRFDRSVARNVDGSAVVGVVELELRHPGGSRSDYVEVTLADGAIRVRRQASERPTAKLAIGLADMIVMGSGAVDPAEFLGAKIRSGDVLLQGDVFLFLRFPAMFKMATRQLVEPGEALLLA